MASTWVLVGLSLLVLATVVIIGRADQSVVHLPWVYYSHKLRRHDVHWFARNHKVTKVECRTCRQGRIYL
jgi:hypothetical protein